MSGDNQPSISRTPIYGGIIVFIIFSIGLLATFNSANSLTIGYGAFSIFLGAIFGLIAFGSLAQAELS